MADPNPIGFGDRTKIHPWRGLLVDIIDNLTACTFEEVRSYTKDIVPRKVAWETEVGRTYNDVTPEDFSLMKRKYFDGLEKQYGCDYPSLLKNLFRQTKQHISSQAGTFAVTDLIGKCMKAIEEYEVELRSQGLLTGDAFIGRENFVTRVENDLFGQSDYVQGRVQFVVSYRFI